MRKRISSQTCAKSIRYLNKIAAVTHTLIHTCEQLKYACLFEWLYDRKEVVCPIFLTPYLLVFTGPRKTRLSMLFADALKNHRSDKKRLYQNTSCLARSFSWPALVERAGIQDFLTA
jgi:hypothetical protein